MGCAGRPGISKLHPVLGGIQQAANVADFSYSTWSLAWCPCNDPLTSCKWSSGGPINGLMNGFHWGKESLLIMVFHPIYNWFSGAHLGCQTTPSKVGSETFGEFGDHCEPGGSHHKGRYVITYAHMPYYVHEICIHTIPWNLWLDFFYFWVKRHLKTLIQASKKSAGRPSNIGYEKPQFLEVSEPHPTKSPTQFRSSGVERMNRFFRVSDFCFAGFHTAMLFFRYIPVKLAAP